MSLVLGLAPGRVGFYDPLSRMHFHLARPVQNVPDGVKTSGLEIGVQTGALVIVEGSFQAPPETVLPHIEDTKEPEIPPAATQIPSDAHAEEPEAVEIEQTADEAESVPELDPERCQAITASGAQCKRTPIDGSKYCAFHSKGHDESAEA